MFKPSSRLFIAREVAWFLQMIFCITINFLLFSILRPTLTAWLFTFSCIVINHQFFKHWKTLKTENETLSHIRGKILDLLWACVQCVTVVIVASVFKLSQNKQKFTWTQGPSCSWQSSDGYLYWSAEEIELSLVTL